MKVYRVVLMIVDLDEIDDKEEIQSLIENVRYPNRCISPSVYEIKEKDIGEWDDDNLLNMQGSWMKEFERMFMDSEK